MQCLELAGRECPDGYDVDRDDGRTMLVACKRAGAAAAPYVAVSAKGVRFEVPSDWTAKAGMWFSADESSAVVVDAAQAVVGAEDAATAAMENADERWSGTVNGHHVVFVTGEMRGSEAGLRVTRAVTVVDGRAYALTCAHRGTRAVSKVCMRILNSMRVE